MLDWQQQRCDEGRGRLFSYYAVQVGWPALQALRCNRMPRRWLAAQEAGLIPRKPILQAAQAQLVCHPEALPFAEASIDLLVLPRTLGALPIAPRCRAQWRGCWCLKGRVLIFGLNRWSVWGARSMGWKRPALTQCRRGLSYWRLRDWLQLLDLEVLAVDFSCHAPALETALWQQRWAWLDALRGNALGRCWAGHTACWR